MAPIYNLAHLGRELLLANRNHTNQASQGCTTVGRFRMPLAKVPTYDRNTVLPSAVLGVRKERRHPIHIRFVRTGSAQGRSHVIRSANAAYSWRHGVTKAQEMVRNPIFNIVHSAVDAQRLFKQDQIGEVVLTSRRILKHSWHRFWRIPRKILANRLKPPSVDFCRRNFCSLVHFSYLSG